VRFWRKLDPTHVAIGHNLGTNKFAMAPAIIARGCVRRCRRPTAQGVGRPVMGSARGSPKLKAMISILKRFGIGPKCEK
jgi:hypothetical protein